MILIAREESNLAKEIAKLKNWKLITFFTKQFSDGEVYIRFNENFPKRKDEITVLLSLFPANENIARLIILLDNFKEKRINLILPYLAYSRQHKKFLDLECISAKALASLIERFRVKKITTFNVHSDEVKRFYRKTKLVNIDVFEEIIKYFKDRFDVVLLPDDEKDRISSLRKLSKKYNFELNYLVKERDRYTNEVKTYLSAEISVENKRVLIIDDMIATGNTIINSLNILKDLNVKEVYVSCVHGLFLNNCDEKILGFDFVKEIVCTNTIENKYSKISVAKFL